MNSSNPISDLNNLKKMLLKTNFRNDNERQQKEFITKVLDQFIEQNNNFNEQDFWKGYNNKKEQIKRVVNSSP